MEPNIHSAYTLSHYDIKAQLILRYSSQ